MSPPTDRSGLIIPVDPTRPENFDAMASIARKVDVPIATGERLQLAACIPNFAIQEYPYEQDGGEPGRELLAEPLERGGGYLRVPDRPGIGVELDESAVAEGPYEPRDVVTRLHEDGSVVDQ